MLYDEITFEMVSLLYRKIEKDIKNHFDNDINKILVINGARQIGKSFIIRKVCSELFKNYCEINLLEDKIGEQLFTNIKTLDDFYLTLSIKSKSNLEDTIIFLDEIQECPNLLPLLKFLNTDNKYKYICSGSLLGLTLANITSIPMGSILVKQMYQLDFEEFLIANNINNEFINIIKTNFINKISLEENIHNKMLDLFKKYLIVGGLPDAVNAFIIKKDIKLVRGIHTDTINFYSDEASKYDKENNLKIKRIYSMIPSIFEQKKKRLIIQNIDNVKGRRFSNYVDSFDYLINSGICLEVKSGKDYKAHSAISKLIKDGILKKAIVFSNNRLIEEIANITYYPIYMVMFLNKEDVISSQMNDLLFDKSR